MLVNLTVRRKGEKDINIATGRYVDTRKNSQKNTLDFIFKRNELKLIKTDFSTKSDISEFILEVSKPILSSAEEHGEYILPLKGINLEIVSIEGQSLETQSIVRFTPYDNDRGLMKGPIAIKGYNTRGAFNTENYLDDNHLSSFTVD